MIICYEGTPGSGKSLDAVCKIIDNLRLGRTVYTNIAGLDNPVCREHIKIKAKLDDYEIATRLIYLSDIQITDPSNYVKQGALIVIDEVHKRLNARNWQTAQNKVWTDWGSTHRHGGFDVVLITQGLEKVDSQIRGLVEFTHRYKKNNYFGRFLERKYFVKVYEEDSTKIIGRRSGSYDQSIFKCYKSYVAGNIKEQKIQANVNVLKHPVFYALPVMLLVTLYMFSKSSFMSGDLFGSKARLDKQAEGVPIESAKLQPRVYEEIIEKKPKNKALSVPKVAKSELPLTPPVMVPASFPSGRPLPPAFGGQMGHGVPLQRVPFVSEKLEVEKRVERVALGCAGDECWTVVDGQVVPVK
jgi:zona occludens toxin (predicted ATPase)